MTMKKMGVALAAILAVASLASAQQAYKDGQALTLCKLWDGADIIAIDASGNLTCNAGTGTFTVAGTVAATQSGTWNITNISGTVSLPTGASTSANQTTEITALQLIDNLPNTLGSSTAGQSGALALGAVTTAAPSYTNGQTNALSITPAGNLRVDGSTVTQPVSGTVTVTDGAGALNVIVDSGTLTAVTSITNVVHVDDNASSLTVDAPAATPVATRPSTGAAFVDPFNLDLDSGAGTVNRESMGVAYAGAGGPVATSAAAPLPTALYDTGTGAIIPIGSNGVTTGLQVLTINTTLADPGTSAAKLGKAEDAAHTSVDTGVFVLGVRTDPTTTARTSADGDYSPVAVDHVGAVATGVHPGRFSCFIALTATATTQCQAAPAAGLRNYVTSMECSNGAATVQGVDIVFGTGAACVTGITALTHKYQMGTNALTTSPFEIHAYYGPNTPLVPNAATAICVRPTAASAFGCTLTGFIAP